jgi:hypothetical protein
MRVTGRTPHFALKSVYGTIVITSAKRSLSIIRC